MSGGWREQYILDYTRGIAFLGTPHFDTDFTAWARMFAGFESLFQGMSTATFGVPESDSEWPNERQCKFLAKIQLDFQMVIMARRSTRTPIKITRFYERPAVLAVETVS
jgi:hypothetical protein